ncbi:T7SS effector LXG polymorphic toxin [Priestia koreensis]|uniref:T7SS effector LXG polymorphic toxin n=1 Tax=Priestia koreensis TaxID=284581 RepID=UPI001F599B60|nr:T7SS effector LXG polymorphic toxin [Priestia koreensis]UNL83237.1 ribonuclease YeeF family protein [Priestia koreensis]
MGKVYDAEGISTFAKEREKSYKALKKQLDALKKTLQAVVDLDDSLKGKGADKIKGFYRYQVDTADNWINLVGMLQSYFSTLYVKAEEAKLSGETFVTVPFLEQDVQNGISQAKKLVDQQQTDLQKIFNTIDDILPLSVFSKETYDEYMDKAEKKRNSTVNAVEKLDADWLESYSAIDSNQTIVTTSTQLLHDATTKGGQAYPVLFDEKAYHESPLYQVRKEANEYATNYIDYNKEMAEVHKLKEEEKRREIEEANKEWYEKAWDAASTFTGEVTGYYDSKRAVEGIDPVTGRKLSASERVAAGAMAAAGFIPVVGWAGRAIKGGKGIYAVAKGVNAADHALDAYKTTKSLEVLSKAEKGLYGLVAANGLYEFGTGKDMFGNEISDEQRQNSLLQSLGIVGAGVVSTKLAAKTAKAGANAVVTSTKKLTAMRNVLSTQATERLIPAVQKGQRVYRAVANEVKNTMKKVGEIKIAPKSIKVFQTDGAPIPIWMVDDWYKVKDLGRMFSVGGREAGSNVSDNTSKKIEELEQEITRLKMDGNDKEVKRLTRQKKKLANKLDEKDIISDHYNLESAKEYERKIDNSKYFSHDKGDFGEEVTKIVAKDSQLGEDVSHLFQVGRNGIDAAFLTEGPPPKLTIIESKASDSASFSYSDKQKQGGNTYFQNMINNGDARYAHLRENLEELQEENIGLEFNFIRVETDIKITDIGFGVDDLKVKDWNKDIE